MASTPKNTIDNYSFKPPAKRPVGVKTLGLKFTEPAGASKVHPNPVKAGPAPGQ